MTVYPKFIKSASGPESYHRHEGVEFAFLGASNSGKSTFVNALIGKNLCKTSSKPGHTSLINFFDVKKGLVLVDLPGYGFAKRSQKEQKKWQKSIETYLSERENLVLCYVLFDLKRGLMKSDFDLLEWLEHENVPYGLVATKIDKLNQKERSAALKDLKEQGLAGDLFLTSSLKKKGIKEVWSHIDSLTELSASQDS